MDSKGTYNAGLIVNIVFGAMGFIALFGLGIWSSIITDSLLFDDINNAFYLTFTYFQDAAIGIVVAYFVSGSFFLISIILSSIALSKYNSKKNSRGWGIASGVFGLFTTPFFIGGILTLVSLPPKK